MSPLSVIITIAAYFAILFTVSYIAGRKADNAGFFVGNRKSSWYVVAFAMIGSSISGVTYVSVPGMVAASNFGYLQMVLGFIAGQLIIAFVLTPLFYRMNLVSIYEYLENRFGMSSYRTGAWFFFISKMLGAAVRLFLVCLTLQLLVFKPFGLPFILNVAITVALVWLYTFRGGVKSLIWTDSLKTFCLVVSVVLCICYIASDLNLSFTGMLGTIADSDMSRIFFFDDVNSKQYFFKQFFAGAFTMIAMTGLDQDMMQRNLSCKNFKDSQKNMITSVISQFFVILLFLMLLCSCSSEDKLELHKGATLPIMQGIADNVPYIQSVEKELTYDLYDGVRITDVVFTYCAKPTRMIIAEVDLNKNVTIVTSTPDNKPEVGKILQQVTVQAEKAEAAGRKVILGTNGDFYSKKNDLWIPGGLFYKDGVAIKTEIGWEADHVFYMLKDGTAHITSVPEFKLVEREVVHAIGGWQRMVQDGEVVKNFTVNDNAMQFHPRTFVGVSADNRKVYLFVVDGRQPEYSNGMRLEDMMLLCQGAGCYQAFNMDGGGSTTMVRRVEKGSSVSFEVMNQPSDNPARSVINGLQVIEKTN